MRTKNQQLTERHRAASALKISVARIMHFNYGQSDIDQQLLQNQCIRVRKQKTCTCEKTDKEIGCYITLI